LNSPNAYESCCMSTVMGEALRPGGFSLTERAVQFCGLSIKASVLDLGCGRGATVNYLHEKHNISAIGLDPSEKLISQARESYFYADFRSGKGETPPFENESFDCVFAECTLSLMTGLYGVLEQVDRILKNGGHFVITDVYARNPQNTELLNEFSLNSCMRGLHDLEKLQASLERAGFRILLVEDYSDLMKELVVKIGFSYGSMADFWKLASDGCVNGEDFSRKLKQCRPGYFLIIAEKGAEADG